MAWRRRYKETHFVGTRRSGWRIPDKPEEEGNYLLGIDEDGVAGWKMATDDGSDVTLEDLGGAKLNGDCEEQFSVKEATDDCHAVNKKQFDDKIDWLIAQPIDGGSY